MIAIVVHGGAGNWSDHQESAVRGVAHAAAVGWEVLARDGSALEAVTRAVVTLEDDPLFNAGTGSVLTTAGGVEMDASVMVGESLGSGGVACLTRVRNPVLVARRVLEATDCVLLAGENATAFARAQGFPDYDPVTERRLAEWQSTPVAAASDTSSAPGTVGAVAVDRARCLAAATSTGGRWGKPPGRVGDSPIPGAGNYATAKGAVSATGHGELMLRAVTARAIVERIEAGASPAEAARAVLTEMERRFGIPIGVICLDADGGVGVFHGTPAMPHARRRDGDDQMTARLAMDSAH